MKKGILLFVCMMTAILIGYAQGTIVTFDETTHDFGEISEKGGRVTHDFIFTNTSNSPITVTRVKASCGCTTPSWTKTPVLPGETGKITATFNPVNQPNKFSKTVTVTFSEGSNARLVIKGTILKGDIPIEKQYPISYGPFRLKKNTLDFGKMTPNKTKTLVLDVYNNADQPYAPEATNVIDYIKYAPGVIPAKSSDKLEFTINTKSLKYGKTSGVFRLRDSNKISYQVVVIDDFSTMSAEDKANAGALNLGSNELAFGVNKNSEVLRISNSGKSDLHIRAVQSDNSKIEFSKTSLTIKPGKIAEIKVKYPVGKSTEREFPTTITIYSDDPNAPIKTIRLTQKD